VYANTRKKHNSMVINYYNKYKMSILFFLNAIIYLSRNQT